jgi:hypothetical protein
MSDGTTAGSSAAAYVRGVNHLKRGEHAQAVAAFTAAVLLDPEAANAYVGRALAYRSLGDDAAAGRDEQAARALGGPERSAWDRLVKQGYRRWRGDPGDPAWARDDAVSRDAFLLRQWTWQIHNGGLPQWVANGYGAWADDLARAADAVGTDASRAVADIVRDVAGLLAGCPGAREVMFHMIATRSAATGPVEALFDALSHCEGRYRGVGRYPGEFVADVEAWADRRAAGRPWSR